MDCRDRPDTRTEHALPPPPLLKNTDCHHSGVAETCVREVSMILNERRSAEPLASHAPFRGRTGKGRREEWLRATRKILGLWKSLRHLQDLLLDSQPARRSSLAGLRL